MTFGADIHTAFMFKLDPYTNYSITVAGYTSVGLGVEKHFIIETKQGGKGTNITVGKVQLQKHRTIFHNISCKESYK